MIYYEKAVWSRRERRLATGHANGSKVKIFSREEVAALERSRREKMRPVGGRGADDPSGVTKP